MNKELQVVKDKRFEIFSKENLGSVRTVLIDNEVWFCLKDVCDILGLTNVTEVKKRLNQKGLSTIEVGVNTGLTIQNIKMIFITESNLYKAIMQSRKPEAEIFTDWIVEEVIPSIKKTGKYELEQKSLSPAQYLLQQAQWMVEAENRMNNIETEMTGINKQISRIEHNERRTITSNHLTVIAYANMKGIKPNSYNSSAIGRKATKICRTRGLITGTVVDSKYGLINTYPLEVLDEVFFG